MMLTPALLCHKEPAQGTQIIACLSLRALCLYGISVASMHGKYLYSKYIISFLCRVTKFKINWDSNSTENSENIPPKTDPNQMSSENSQSLEGPLKSGGGQASSLPAGERMEMD